MPYHNGALTYFNHIVEGAEADIYHNRLIGRGDLFHGRVEPPETMCTQQKFRNLGHFEHLRNCTTPSGIFERK